MGTAAINMAYISALFNMLLQWIQLIEMILILSRLVHFLSYDVAPGSEITPCTKIDKPLVV